MNAGNPVQIDLFGVSATRTKDTRLAEHIGGYGAGRVGFIRALIVSAVGSYLAGAPPSDRRSFRLSPPCPGPCSALLLPPDSTAGCSFSGCAGSRSRRR
jgi:hypothetical protein